MSNNQIMKKQQQFRELIKRVNKLPLYLQLTIVPYLDHETKAIMKTNVTQIENENQQFLRLISVSLFVNKYISSTDRSIYLNFYSQPAFTKYETTLLGEISQRNPQKYFTIQKSIQQLLQEMGTQIKCLQSGKALIQMIQLQIQDPQIPLPRMRKQGIAMHCNSQLQFGLVDLKFEGPNNEDAFVQDCVLDLEELISCLGQSLNQLVIQKLNKEGRQKSVITLMKQCYYHPQIINLLNYRNYLISELIPFNLFVYMHAILSGIAQMYQQYIIDQQKQFQRFIQFQMRYCIYRSIVVSLQASNLSKLLYQSVYKLLSHAQQFIEEKQINQKIIKVEQQTIIEASLELQNKKSGEQNQLQIKQLTITQRKSKVQSEHHTYQSVEVQKNQVIQMSSRLYLSSGKIWMNQSKRLKSILQQSPSPSKFSIAISQQNINNKSFIKILNRLSYVNILDKLQKQIFELTQTQFLKQQNSSLPLRDQDIANIFGPPSENSDENSPTHSYNSINHSSPQSPTSPYSPCQSYSSFSSMLRSSKNQSCSYELALSAIENKIRAQPYRFQKNRDINYNEVSPDKQKDIEMPQIQLDMIRKLPSLKHNKLLSKVSMVSKFTKFTDARAVGSVQELIQQDIIIQQQILTQYNSYLMDISVNEVTVHWCGHSQQHLMGEYYNNFQEYLIKYNSGFICYLIKIGEQVCQKMLQSNKKCHQQKQSPACFKTLNKILKQLVQWHISYLDIGLVCKRTLRKLIKTANQWILQICLRQKIQKQEIELVNLNFYEVDHMIEHYNEQIWNIGKNVPESKLKIYQQRKSIKNCINFIKPKQGDFSNKQKHSHEHRKCEKRRRNSEQALVLHKSD